MKSNEISLMWTPLAKVIELSFRAARFIHLMTFLAMSAVSGCVYMLESVSVLHFELFGVSDSLGERLRIFSVGNVELIFELAVSSESKNWMKGIINDKEETKLSFHSVSKSHC